MFCFSIGTKKLIEQITRFGVVERKTKILQQPSLYNDEIKYLSSLFKGIIDGDGWVSKDGKQFFISSASNGFIKWCKNILENNFHMFDLRIIEKNNFYILRSAKKQNIAILKEKIYNNSIGMVRKYNRIHQII